MGPGVQRVLLTGLWLSVILSLVLLGGLFWVWLTPLSFLIYLPFSMYVATMTTRLVLSHRKDTFDND